MRDCTANDCARPSPGEGDEVIGPIGPDRTALGLAAFQFVRFLPIGGGAAAVSYVVYMALVGLGLPTAPAKGAGFSCGAALSFFSNRRFTFAHAATSRRTVAYFCGLYAATLLFNVAVNEASLFLIGSKSAISLTSAWLIATGCSSLTNFLGMKLLVFRGAKPTRKR